MKYFIFLALSSILFVSCKNKNAKIVDKDYADSLISHYKLPAIVTMNQKDMDFWESRIHPKDPRQVNESKYAATLVSRFHFLGDISDVKKADNTC